VRIAEEIVKYGSAMPVPPRRPLALLDALNDYEGAVMLITHDRSLIELLADRLAAVLIGG
jgi:hypothetical protein